MGLSGWRQIRLRERVLLWLLPALVFRALIPAGFMPADGRGLLLELCSGQGFGALHAAYDPPQDDTGHGPPGEEPCAFAASAAMGPLPLVAAVAVAAPAATQLAAEPASRVLPPVSSLRPQPRAPPRVA